MKLSTFLLTCLLLATASVAVAADNPAPAPEVTAPVQAQPAVAEQSAPADEVLATPAVDCTANAEPLITTGLEKQVPAALTCGACSSSNCQGARRGQICHLGSGQGWGNCNIYSGGYICPTGGWECQCGSGPLP